MVGCSPQQVQQYQTLACKTMTTWFEGPILAPHRRVFPTRIGVSGGPPGPVRPLMETIAVPKKASNPPVSANPSAHVFSPVLLTHPDEINMEFFSGPALSRLKKKKNGRT